VHERHVTDRFVILEVTVSGTHLGDWRGLPAMGKRMESRVCALYSFDDKGMLGLERTYYDKAKTSSSSASSPTRARPPAR
jgi:hypothetical protein